MGDSVANGGTQINDDEAYPALLEGLLGHGAEVVNASAGGWALDNARNWLAEHGTLGARVIVLEINEGDLGQAFADGNLLDVHPSFPTRAPACGLCEIATRYILPKIHHTSLADPGSQGGHFTPDHVAGALQAVKAIEQQASQAGARLVVMYWDPRNAGPGEGARRQLFAWAQQHQVPIVRPQLNRDIHAQDLFRDAIHPTVMGNAVIAAQLQPVVSPLLF